MLDVVLDETVEHLGREQGFSCVDAADSVGELLRRRVFEEECAGTCGEGAIDVIVHLEHRQNDYLRSRVHRVLGDLLSCGDAVAVGHADIHQHNVRA